LLIFLSSVSVAFAKLCNFKTSAESKWMPLVFGCIANHVYQA